MKKDIEFEAALSKFKADVRSTRTMLIVFFLVVLISRIVFKVPIPSLVILTLLVWFLLYFVYENLIRRARSADGIYNLYFKYNIGDLLFLTFLIHYLGGAGWIGAILYILVLVTSGLVLPKKRAVILGIAALFFYSGLVFLEYFEIISHRHIFVLEPEIYRSLPYVAVQLLVVTAVFYFVTETAGTFSEILRSKTKQLEEIYQETETARGVLEIRVKARTKELRELMNRQEEIIEKRTGELEKKVEELERFRKLAVGRELRMVELKKEVDSLKGQIENHES